MSTWSSLPRGTPCKFLPFWVGLGPSLVLVPNGNFLCAPFRIMLEARTRFLSNQYSIALPITLFRCSVLIQVRHANLILPLHPGFDRRECSFRCGWQASRTGGGQVTRFFPCRVKGDATTVRLPIDRRVNTTKRLLLCPRRSNLRSVLCVCGHRILTTRTCEGIHVLPSKLYRGVVVLLAQPMCAHQPMSSMKRAQGALRVGFYFRFARSMNNVK